MKKLNLYLDFEFTSLSPDAQPISLGIVSDVVEYSIRVVGESLIDKSLSQQELSKFIYDNKLGKEIKESSIKLFYAEFTDFDIYRCDDWVKKNVVEKLKHYRQQSGGGWSASDDCFKYECYNDTDRIKVVLKEYLEQFSDYEIQIVVDCGTWDWIHFLHLVGEWEMHELYLADRMFGKKYASDELKRYGYNNIALTDMQGADTSDLELYKVAAYGLPKLPSNISPVPFDLNDIIAIKKGISPKEAFDLNREVLAFGRPDLAEHEKHNSLFDAKIIKVIYQKLTQ